MVRAAFATALLLSAAGAFLPASAQTGEAGMRAFTVNFISTVTNLKSGKVSVSYQILAQRADGTVATQHATPVGPIIMMESFAERASIRIDPTHRNKWTTYYTAAQVADIQSRHSPDNKCAAALTGAGVQYLGEGTLLGHSVHKYGSGQFLANQNRYEYLVDLAPELNCLRVRQDTFLLDNQGHPLSHIVEAATAISIGDPDPSLFEAVERAKEVSPLKYYMDINGVDSLDAFDPGVQDAIKRYEKLYADNHKLAEAGFGHR